MKYHPTIGLEIHAELKTRTKMFCASLNDPEEKHPNVNVCPVCLGHPGTLPTINQEAVMAVVKLGMAIGGRIAKHSYFDRKSYFYPDLPKGYQISQYEHPLVEGGNLIGVRIRRVHLEEDTGALSHANPNNYSLVNFNRAGIPLMELVTEPDIKSADEAVKFAKELQLILRYLGISGADMEKGQMRVEANISLKPEGTEELGTKVEVKNINSFKAVKGAIEFEFNRQQEVLESGGQVVQETRGWDDVKVVTKSQRVKESAHDYRYFPEPDLPPLDLSLIDLEKLRLEIPELPAQKRERMMKEYGLNREQVEILAADRFGAEYFEDAASELRTYNLELMPYTLLYNYFTSDLWGLIAKENVGLADLKIKPENLSHLVYLIDKGDLSSRMAKDVLLKMFQTGLDPESIVKESGGAQIKSESDLEEIVGTVIKENPEAVADYQKGKQNAVQFLIGQAMKKSQGRGNPETLRKLFDQKI